MHSRISFSFLDVKRFLSRDFKRNPRTISNSRRMAIKRLSFIIFGLSPLIKTLGKSLSAPFTIQRKGRGIRFLYNREVAWEIDPVLFGEDATLRYHEIDERVILELRNAYYPNSPVRVDFKVAVFREYGTWKMDMHCPHLGINNKVNFLDWLEGKSTVSGRSEKDLRINLGRYDSLQIPQSGLTLNKKWKLSFKPSKSIDLSLAGTSEYYGNLIISLVPPSVHNWLNLKQSTPVSWFILNDPHGNFELLTKYLYQGGKVLTTKGYPFTETGLALTGGTSGLLWACNESGSESVTEYCVGGEDQTVLSLYRSRFVKEYSEESEPFALLADLGEKAQWYGASGAAFALAGSATSCFSLFGEKNTVSNLECNAQLVETNIAVDGARSLPAHYDVPSEVSILPQDPVIRRTQTVRSGQIQTIGAIEQKVQNDRVNWLYVNKESLRIRFRTDKPIMFNVIRPEDFLNLQFEFVNFTLDGNLLRIDNKKDPSFLIVRFPSQHTRERAFHESVTPQLPVPFIRAGSSRLVFRVPPEYTPIPLTMPFLLNWKNFDLQVNYRARWFNPAAAVSRIRETLRGVSMVFSTQRTPVNLQVRGGVSDVKTRDVKTIAPTSAATVTTQKPMSALEVKVEMAGTPQGSGVMALSDNQLSNILAIPEIELNVTENFRGALLNLLEMKAPSAFETSIEAPTHAEISPNQFAGFNHAIILRDEFGDYNAESVSSINVKGEGDRLQVTPARQAQPVTSQQTQIQQTVRTQQIAQTTTGQVSQVAISARRNYKDMVSPVVLKLPAILALKQGQLFELWHTRMGIRLASGEVDESALNRMKTIRVLWSRWANANLLPPPLNSQDIVDNIPKPVDFHELVHLTSNLVGLKEEFTGKKVVPEPVKANQLMLSALGAWFNYEFRMDADVEGTGLKAWIQRATMGRDQYIKVIRRGYLFPFGHQAVKITTSTREIRIVQNVATAVMIIRVYIIVTQPELFYGKDQNSGFIPFPFQRVEIKDLEKKIFPVEVIPGVEEIFMSHETSNPDPWRIEVDDAMGQTIRLQVPLTFVDGSLTTHNQIVDHYNNQKGWDYFSSSQASRSIAYARSLIPGDTSFETGSIMFGARSLQYFVNKVRFYPEIKEASVYVRQMEELTGERKPVRIGLVNDDNLSMVFAKVLDDEKPALVFADSEKSGGFLTPNMSISGFSKLTGLTGNKIEELDKLVVQVNEIFSLAESSMPKIFGIINFVDLLLPNVDLSSAINAVKNSILQIRNQIESLQKEILSVLARVDTELKKLDVFLDIIGSLLDQSDVIDVLKDVQKLTGAFENYGVSVAGNLQESVSAAILVGKEMSNKGVELENLAGFIGNPQALKNKLLDAGISMTPAMNEAVDRMLQLVQGLLNKGLGETEITALIGGLGLASRLTDIQSLIKDLAGQVADKVLQAIPEIPNVKFQIKGNEIIVEYHWKPKTKESYSAGSLFSIKNLKSGTNQIDIALDSILTKTIDLKQPPALDVRASINEFSIVVANTLQLNFAKIAFKSGTGSKTDIDVKFQTVPIRLIGSLSFVNSLQSVIKSDQFSAGPYIDITEKGIVAGYNFPLPNLEVGILAISNMMLGTKLTLPFTKDPLKIGFNFCTRENPFKLMVSCFGGGGFFMMETTMQGLTRLDVAFEFGAGISLNVGVASGSVEVKGGIYYCLIIEENISTQSLTAYLRITGRLSILGIIKVTLEFYLELRYEAIGSKTTEDGLAIAGSSRLVGTATLSVKIEVLFFSKTVKVTVSRTLAGNDADPKFEETYTLEHWQTYAAAFAS